MLPCYILLLYSYHQDRNAAVFAHPAQPNWSGSVYNNSPAIPRKSKQIHLRNSFWKYHYTNSIYLAQFLTTRFQYGGNSCEAMHADVQQKMPWLKKQQIGIARAPAMDQIAEHITNFAAVSRLDKDMIDNPDAYSEYERKQTIRIKSLMDATTGLDSIINEKMNPQTSHMHIKWDDFDKTLKHHLKSLVFFFFFARCIF